MMSDAGKSQEPSMEEILASIRRIIAEDEAGRVRSGAPPMPPRAATERPSPPPPQLTARSAPPAIAPPRPGYQTNEAGEMVLDLTNMVAADGSVVTIAPTFPNENQGAGPAPQGFAAPASEQQTVPYGGFPRRAPPPGPGAASEARAPTPPPLPPPLPAQAGPAGFAPAAERDSPSRRVRSAGPPSPLPPLSEDSPSRRVFKRRHTAGSAFAELAQSSFTSAPAEANAGYGKVPVGAVATELDMNAGSPSQAFEPKAPLSDHGQAAQYAPSPFAPPPAPHGASPTLSEDQVRRVVNEMAEPILRAWLDANLAPMVEQQLASLVQARVDDAVSSSLPQLVDQHIHQNVEANLGPYIEDRVGAHVDARLAAAVEEKVAAGVKREVTMAIDQRLADTVSQHVARAVSEQVTQAVSQQLQTQQQNLTRVVDERVKGEIRNIFQRLAGN